MISRSEHLRAEQRDLDHRRVQSMHIREGMMLQLMGQSSGFDLIQEIHQEGEWDDHNETHLPFSGVGVSIVVLENARLTTQMTHLRCDVLEKRRWTT